MEVNNVAVMRRRNDSWLNATQILKVAGVDKGKRTKILEKEIQTGEHEKVQGGYGKYQGTWIKFERGVEVCQQYGVEELLRPLLTYDMGQDGGVTVNTPTKEQAMAAQRKRTMYASQEAKHGNMQSTFFKSISSTASQAVAAISKARFDSPGPRNRVSSQQPGPRPAFSRQGSMQTVDEMPSNSQQSALSALSEYGAEAPPYGPPSHASAAMDEPPRKKQRIATPAVSFSYGQTMDSYASGAFPPPSPTEVNESFYQSNYHQPSLTAAADIVGSGQLVPPLSYEMTPEADSARQQMYQLFVGPDMIADDSLGNLSPALIDMPIDSLCNNSLHYAATLARVRMLATLVSLGGNIWRVNADGDTPLMRASIVVNSHDASCYPELLDILGCTLDARDHRGRTVLHKIALVSGLKGRAASSKYYLESLLEWVVRSGSQPSSQATNPSSSSQRSSTQQHMTLARFINEIVDAQDLCGDTALMIAARIGNKSIISQLLEVGADPTIANHVGLKPTTFGVGIPADRAGLDSSTPYAPPSGGNSRPSNPSPKVKETNEDMLTCKCHVPLRRMAQQLLSNTRSFPHHRPRLSRERERSHLSKRAGRKARKHQQRPRQARSDVLPTR